MPRKPMTGWYNPTMLARTAVRVAISTVFGQFADRRLAMASLTEIDPAKLDDALDYSGKGGADGFWFDFMADTGDGWDSTFAVARMLAEEELDVGAARELPRGSVLIMGGDQVYPVASLEEYRARLLGPFDLAASPPSDGKKPPKPHLKGGWAHLYAIPGNHDWYDGLNSFLALFCRRRLPTTTGLGVPTDGKSIGGRETFQTRSYFALKLPGNWWLWATDSQLEGYIDQPQLDYFRHVASNWMDPKSNVILCTGTPDWEYVDKDKVPETFNKFSLLERLAGMAKGPDGKEMEHQLRLAISGDSHHYAHYTEDDRHYLTCGGGGAFLHPTHQLTGKDFTTYWPKPGEKAKWEATRRHDRHLELEKVYPGTSTSFWLAWRNLGFAVLNPGYVLFLGIAYALFLWTLQARSGAGSLVKQFAGHDLWEIACQLWSMAFSGPGPASLVAASLAVYVYFADARKPIGRIALGVVHGIIQSAAATFTIALVYKHWPCPTEPLGSALALVSATLAAAVASATVFGAYLLTALNIFKCHWNEAFSSLAIRHYKCFLRLQITGDGTLHVNAVGLDTVPRDRKAKRPKLSPHLIETITIQPKGSKP